MTALANRAGCDHPIAGPKNNANGQGCESRRRTVDEGDTRERPRDATGSGHPVFRHGVRVGASARHDRLNDLAFAYASTPVGSHMRR